MKASKPRQDRDSPMVWNLAEVTRATQGTIVRGRADMLVPSVATDSRQIEPGALFFALRGPRFDGHRFVGEALARGACGAVVTEEVPVATGALVRVSDTERALGDLALYTRRQAGLRVFAVAGSNGKTTTKEMLAAICARRWPGQVLKTEGNRNNLIGLPLTLLGWRGEAIAVLELGMNRPGELGRLTEIASPDLGVLTNIGEEHLEGLGTIAGVAAAEGELFSAMSPTAVAVVNADDPLVCRAASAFCGRTVYFGAGTDVRSEHVVNLGIDGVAFDLHCGGGVVRVRLRLPGRHNVANAVAAAAMAWVAGVESAQIAAGLETVRPVPMRMEIRRLRNNVTVINDSYNANPGSMEAALQALVSLPGRSLAVLGEMRELGVESVDAHRRLGERAAVLGVDLLVVVGEVAGAVADGACAAGMRAASVIACGSHAEAAAAVTSYWRSGDVVLVKGSRGAEMERATALLEEAGNRP